MCYVVGSLKPKPSRIIGMDEIGYVRNILKSLEKRLYALNTVLRELYRVKEFLERATNEYDELRSILTAHPELEALVREYVRDQEMLPAVKDVKAKYEAVLDLFREYRHRLDDMELFFERFRNYRYYVLDDEKVAPFLGDLFGDEETVLFRQTLTRKPFTEEFAREVEGVLVDPFTIKVPGYKVPLAVERFIIAYGTGYTLESPKYSLTYKPEHGLFRVTFSDSSKIPEVDALVRRLGGEIINI